MNYKTIIGLETHIELKTEKKMFCGCSANYFGEKPNSHVCPVCLGLPGALPVPNRDAIERTILLALALNCKINTESFFERKHYFYPDLPKGYQISQYLKPLGYDGYLEINGKKIKINRVHLEEDTGKLLHGQQFNDHGQSYVDYNRSSVPLVEIVTEPVVENGNDASAYLKELQLVARYLNVSDCDMEKGSMRCEPNISVLSQEVWDKNQELPKYKSEVKNINSFRFVKKAIDFERERQILVLEEGQTPIQETRRFVESTGKTESMRSKESAHDYRYFPEPDIPPMHFTETELEGFGKKLKSHELPNMRRQKLVSQFKLSTEYASLLTENKEAGDLFLEASALDSSLEAKSLASLIINKKVDVKKGAMALVEVAKAKTVKTSVDENKLKETIDSVVRANPKAVTDYKAGKQGSLQFLLGQTLRILGRQVEVPVIMKALQTALEK